jgi:hypothetical protein
MAITKAIDKVSGGTIGKGKMQKKKLAQAATRVPEFRGATGIEVSTDLKWQ